jgi:deoxyribonucleoside regulator
MTRSSRQDLLVKVSTLYHKEGLTQGEIASRVKVSRQTVSRLLREAEDVGIVSFDIRDPSGQADELGMRVRSRFNLAAASVVDGGGLDEERALKGTTRVAALACYERMAACSIIGMLWGPTVLQFSFSLPRGQHPGLTIAQMGGMIPTIPGRNAIDPAVTTAAEMLGANADLIAAPLFVDTPVVREAFMSDSRIAAALENARQADMYIFSVGKATIDGGLYQSGYVTATEIAKLESEGAVGELCGLFYSVTGESCGAELESRTIALNRDEIRAIPQRVLIAAGASKAPAVAGALAGGYATEVFLDSELATALLELTDPKRTVQADLSCPACRVTLQYRDGSLVRTGHP